MQNPRLASRYAKSLLDLAVSQDSLDAVIKDMQLLQGICSSNRDMLVLLRSPVVKGDKKYKILDAVFGSRIHKLTAAFVRLLVQKGRESSLPEIAAAFIAQYKERKHIKTVRLTTAVPVEDQVREAILGRIAAGMPDAVIDLDLKTNPDIVGGFVLEMGDRLFDASIRRELNDIRSRFLKNMYVSELR